MSNKAPAYKLNADKKIWAIAGPAIIANSSTPLVGLIDTWVIGHMPDAVHLAAVGLGATVFSFVFWAFGFLRMSTTGLIAQAHGNNDNDQIARIFMRSSTIGFLIAALILTLQFYIFSLSLSALLPPENTAPHYKSYFEIRIWAAPATLFIYTLTGYFIGTAQAKTALYMQLTLNLLNAALNLLFVLHFNMGVTGIALGSLIAEWSAALLGGFWLIKAVGYTTLKHALKTATTWQWARMKKLLQTNGFIFLRTLILMLALGMVTRKAASLGDAALAASQVLNVFLMLISLGLDGFAFSAEALAGAAYGRKNASEFRFWVIRTTLWAFLAAILYSLMFLLFGNDIVMGLTTIKPVQTIAFNTMIIISLLPTFSVWSYQFDGIFIGAAAGKGMFLTMLAAFTAYMFTLQFLPNNYGLPSIWFALLIFMLARGIAQVLYYPKLEHALQS